MNEYLLKKYIETNKELIEKETSLVQETVEKDHIEEKIENEEIEKYNTSISINNSITKIDEFLNEETVHELDSFIFQPIDQENIFDTIKLDTKLTENFTMDEMEEVVEELTSEKTFVEKIEDFVQPIFVEPIDDFSEEFISNNTDEVIITNKKLNIFEKIYVKYLGMKNENIVTNITKQQFFGFKKEKSTKILVLNVVETNECNIHIVSKIDDNAHVGLIGIYYDTQKKMSTTEALFRKIDKELINDNLSYLIINNPSMNFSHKANLFTKNVPFFSIYDFMKRCDITFESIPNLFERINSSHKLIDKEELLQLLYSSIDSKYHSLLDNEIDNIVSITELPLDAREVLLNIDKDFDYTLYIDGEYIDINLVFNQIAKNISYLRLHVNRKVFELI